MEIVSEMPQCCHTLACDVKTVRHCHNASSIPTGDVLFFHQGSTGDTVPNIRSSFAFMASEPPLSSHGLTAVAAAGGASCGVQHPPITVFAREVRSGVNPVQVVIQPTASIADATVNGVCVCVPPTVP